MRDDITITDHPDGAPAFIRPGQLLTEPSGIPAVARWSQAVAESGGVCKVRLSRGVDPCEVAAELRAQGVKASPNHVLVGQPLYFGGPASRPFPVDPVGAPPGEDGKGVTVALFDTGIDPHPWWMGRPWFAEHGDVGEHLDADADLTLDLQAGHGTFVAGLVLRRAPGARLRVTRTLDSHGFGDEALLLHALARLRREPPQVLNLSFGGHTWDDLPSPLVADALARLPGTAVVACAGNTASTRPVWPAALPGVIAVGALDDTGARPASFSARGPWVDACARGEWLTSSFLYAAGFEGYARWSGTSFAAAAVTGEIAAAAARMPVGEAVGHVISSGGREIPDLGHVVTTTG
ncbi:serine protease [Microtetraspora sp. NBRC 13810]|uniref:S8 family peptidase n=1 Tax=Microtetraspora sp. NBRC 13810 TaxID=3030990 RepID=UPI0024A606F3|nr:S8/S53 family peptidase [Microtetraspora sp. NBRC 13810]GLW07922.1 serine protease [Microtetraspora sp. NBRC 13810]